MVVMMAIAHTLVMMHRCPRRGRKAHSEVLAMFEPKLRMCSKGELIEGEIRKGCNEAGEEKLTVRQ
jgi:hypothetical protein